MMQSSMMTMTNSTSIRKIVLIGKNGGPEGNLSEHNRL